MKKRDKFILAVAAALSCIYATAMVTGYERPALLASLDTGPEKPVPEREPRSVEVQDLGFLEIGEEGAVYPTPAGRVCDAAGKPRTSESPVVLVPHAGRGDGFVAVAAHAFFDAALVAAHAFFEAAVLSVDAAFPAGPLATERDGVARVIDHFRKGIGLALSPHLSDDRHVGSTPELG